MEHIFGDHAAKYFASGLPVIPLKIKDKKPILNSWPQYSKMPVPPALQQEWINSFKYTQYCTEKKACDFHKNGTLQSGFSSRS